MNSFLRGIAVLALVFFAKPVHAAVPQGSGDVVVSVDNSKIVKLNAADGTVQWSIDVANNGALKVDPTDLSIYTGNVGSSSKITADGAVSPIAPATLSFHGAMAGDSPTYAGLSQGNTDVNPADGMLYLAGGDSQSQGGGLTVYQMNKFSGVATNWSVDLSSHIKSLDALAVQPWKGGYIYAASAASSKVVVVDPATRSVVTTFDTAISPRFMAINPNGGNVYIADGQNPFVVAYSPTGSLAWVNLNLGGSVSNIATPKGVVGSPAIAACPAPTVRVSSTATSLHKGHSATITFTVKGVCQNVTVMYSVVTRAQSGVDYLLTDSLGNVITTGGQSYGPLTLTALYNSRRRILPISILLLPDPAYYRGNIKVTLQLLGN